MVCEVKTVRAGAGGDLSQETASSLLYSYLSSK